VAELQNSNSGDDC